MLVSENLTLEGTNYINNVTSQREWNVSVRKPYFRRDKYINNVTSQRAGNVSANKPYFAKDKRHKYCNIPEGREC